MVLDQEVIEYRKKVAEFLEQLYSPHTGNYIHGQEIIQSSIYGNVIKSEINRVCKNKKYTNMQVYRIVKDLGMNPNIDFLEFFKLATCSPEGSQKKIDHVLHQIWIGDRKDNKELTAIENNMLNTHKIKWIFKY